MRARYLLAAMPFLLMGCIEAHADRDWDRGRGYSQGQTRPLVSRDAVPGLKRRCNQGSRQACVQLGQVMENRRDFEREGSRSGGRDQYGGRDRDEWERQQRWEQTQPRGQQQRRYGDDNDPWR